MSVSRTVAGQLDQASWIRRMFEEGARLKAERGADRVFDFTLGNPEVEPPAGVIATLRQVVAENRRHTHGYMPNAGFPEVREAIARRIAGRTGLPYTPEHILMTVGSAGAMNVALKSILDPGDEVIVLVPYFPEYRFYIENHAGTVVRVETDDSFQPDVDRIAAAITPRTKAIIVNSPNNPTGALYSAEVLRDLGALLEHHPQVLVLSDEPYRSLVFDGRKQPEVPPLVRRTLVADSWSKALAVPGERIGCLAISPQIEDWAALRDAATFANRVLGFVNAPALWQWVIARAPETTVDVGLYQDKRDLLCDALARMGYEVSKPAGAFYAFPKTPIADDVAFIRILLEEGILAVPGSGFGRAGYIRLSLTVPREMIQASLPGFQRALAAARG
ncbi:MAG: pyridoxal phosphate-dependent aminotransferase [Bryobacteraceae bacterium]|jgi:aspartate aminotransferase